MEILGINASSRIQNGPNNCNKLSTKYYMKMFAEVYLKKITK